MSLIWSVKTDSENINFDAKSLISFLATNLKAKEKANDHSELIRVMVSTIPHNDLLNVPLHNLLVLAFQMGYSYKLFLTKNDVTIKD